MSFVAVDLKNGPGAVYRGEPQQGKPGCTMTASENVFVKMASGELNGQQVKLASKPGALATSVECLLCQFMCDFTFRLSSKEN